MQKPVLVVEDEVGIRRALKRLLADSGFRTIEASNGREAIQRLSDETPAAIVIDLLMPVMSGAELLKALRRNAFYRRIPTVVMTGAPASDVSNVAELMGVPVIFKPNLERLPEVLRGMIIDAGPVARDGEVVAAVPATASGPIATDADSAS